MADIPNLESIKEYEEYLQRVRDRLKSIEELEAKGYKSAIDRQETIDEELKVRQKIASIQAESANLEKSISDIGKTLAGSLLKAASGGDSLTEALSLAAKTGDEKLVKSANSYATLLNSVASGESGFQEILEALATTDFGDFTEPVEKLKQKMKDFPYLQDIFKVSANLFSSLDAATGGILTTVKSIVSATGPIGAIAVVIGLLVNKLIDAAKQALEVRRNLGVSAGDALKLSARMEAAAFQTKLLGGDSEKAKELVTGLVTEFGNVEEASALSTKNIADLTTELGIGGGETAKLLKVLSDVSGESLDTLSSTLEFEASLARAEGIPVAKVMADVAQNADAFARAGADGADEVFRAARAAADLGTNLQTVEGVMDNLVDIEGSLTKEMEAEALIGRQLNLDRARQLAQANDQQGVIDEIIAQVGGPEAFARLGRIEQGALADVFGLSVGQLAPFLGANAGGGGGAVATPQVAKDSLTAANNTNDILSKEHGKNQERHEELLGAINNLNRSTRNLKLAG